MYVDDCGIIGYYRGTDLNNLNYYPWPSNWPQGGLLTTINQTSQGQMHYFYAMLGDSTLTDTLSIMPEQCIVGCMDPTAINYNPWANEDSGNCQSLGGSCDSGEVSIQITVTPDGYPEETNAPYGIAKKAAMVMLDGYRRQYDLNSAYLLPVNLYGPRDNFDLHSSHVIPALIRKCITARDSGADHIECWGTGSASREFLYVDDMAEASLFVHNLDQEIFLTQTKPMLSQINVGTGIDITIKELAKAVKEVVDFDGAIVFDHTKPDGTLRKLMDVSLLSELGWKASMSLKSGLKLSYADFMSKQ